jgi:hypothetical protein
VKSKELATLHNFEKENIGEVPNLAVHPLNVLA